MSRLSLHNTRFLLEKAYAKAKKHHDNLELDPELFINQVLAIIKKQHQAELKNSDFANVLARIHSNDLYLTIACAYSIDQAWKRLDELYRNHMNKVAFNICGNNQQVAEMVQDTLTHLFMTDKAGNRRIASYQGLSSLNTWLATVTHNRTLTEGQSPFRQFEPLETVRDIPDEESVQKVESSTRANLYSQIVSEALRKACQVLNERDKWFFTLRYEEELKVKTIAEMANLKSQTVTYHLQQGQVKLRKEFCSVLKKDHHLNDIAIDECIEEILSNPAYSLPDLLKAK